MVTPGQRLKGSKEAILGHLDKSISTQEMNITTDMGLIMGITKEW